MTNPPPPRFKLIFFTPPSSLPALKSAIFATGAGAYPGPGSYTQVCWSSLGTSQFLPGHGANPTIGQVGKLEVLEEVRCEVLCGGREIAQRAVEALKRVHPYEEPAYEVYKIEDF